MVRSGVRQNVKASTRLKPEAPMRRGDLRNRGFTIGKPVRNQEPRLKECRSLHSCRSSAGPAPSHFRFFWQNEKKVLTSFLYKLYSDKRPYQVPVNVPFRAWTQVWSAPLGARSLGLRGHSAKPGQREQQGYWSGECSEPPYEGRRRWCRCGNRQIVPPSASPGILPGKARFGH